MQVAIIVIFKPHIFRPYKVDYTVKIRLGCKLEVKSGFWTWWCGTSAIPIRYYCVYDTYTYYSDIHHSSHHVQPFPVLLLEAAVREWNRASGVSNVKPVRCLLKYALLVVWVNICHWSFEICTTRMKVACWKQQLAYSFKAVRMHHRYPLSRRDLC